ncbi:IclR family transcriptional regulator [Corynebacterium mendelii]|uniref:IclR family transcriptional regulator n=1 Tax=Corynebacterium mendelii TaxID=2765362 RepID=A0A939E0T8_9CORY|nr:IclR family transcriptional regulator [Corynebacterium mendelii]MBN9644608.1 IclR family transcriptional regulator [Corynebacterium mendelii]
MGQYSAPSSTPTSGIKVLDRAVVILTTVAERPHSLAELCQHTGLPRATAHRLATALEVHRFLARTSEGKWCVGDALTALGSRAGDKLVDAASPIMTALMESTGESVQLYRLTGTSRTCIASLEPPSGLQNTVPIGARMELTAGSAAKVFLAWAPEQLKAVIMPQASFTERDLGEVRACGWADSVAERERGLASLSAPVFEQQSMVAALSISGPAERLAPSPGARWGAELTAAANRLTDALNR